MNFYDQNEKCQTYEALNTFLPKHRWKYTGLKAEWRSISDKVKKWKWFSAR